MRESDIGWQHRPMKNLSPERWLLVTKYHHFPTRNETKRNETEMKKEEETGKKKREWYGAPAYAQQRVPASGLLEEKREEERRREESKRHRAKLFTLQAVCKKFIVFLAQLYFFILQCPFQYRADLLHRKHYLRSVLVKAGRLLSCPGRRSCTCL